MKRWLLGLRADAIQKKRLFTASGWAKTLAFFRKNQTLTKILLFFLR